MLICFLKLIDIQMQFILFSKLIFKHILMQKYKSDKMLKMRCMQIWQFCMAHSVIEKRNYLMCVSKRTFFSPEYVKYFPFLLRMTDSIIKH